jgi:uncharacterized protein DUF3572
MPRLCSMSSDRESVVLSEAELDHTEELVLKILELVHSTPGRLEVFLKQTGFDARALRELAQSPLFMLSALEAVTQDVSLLAELETNAQITRPLIEMTQASLAFHIAAELTRQSVGRIQSLDVGDRARQKLRELSEEKAEGRPAEPAPRKSSSGCGEPS